MGLASFAMPALDCRTGVDCRRRTGQDWRILKASCRREAGLEVSKSMRGRTVNTEASLWSDHAMLRGSMKLVRRQTRWTASALLLLVARGDHPEGSRCVVMQALSRTYCEARVRHGPIETALREAEAALLHEEHASRHRSSRQPWA